MPDINVELCDFARLKRLAYQLLGIQDPNDPDDVIAGSPISKEQVRDALLQSDYNIRILIAGTPAHPFRNGLTWVLSSDRGNGDEMPFLIGCHRRVMITYDSQTREGDIAQHLENLQNHRDKPNLFGFEPFLYWLEGGIIYLGHPTDSIANIEIPNVQIDRTSHSGDGDVSSPVFYEWAVLADAMKMFYIDGSDPANLKFYTELMMMYEAEIKGKALNLPVPEVFKRLAG